MIDYKDVYWELQKVRVSQQLHKSVTAMKKLVHNKKTGQSFYETYYVKTGTSSNSHDNSPHSSDDTIIPSKGTSQPNEEMIHTPNSSKNTPSSISPTNKTNASNPPNSAQSLVANALKTSPSKSKKPDVAVPQPPDYPGSFHTLDETDDVLGRPNDPEGALEQWITKITKDQMKAIRHYSVSLFHLINGIARGTLDNSSLSPQDYQEVINSTQLIEKALSKYELKQDVIVFRQVEETVMLSKFQKALASPDKLFVDEGFFSTTPLKGSFNDISKPMDIVVKVPKGKGRGAWIKYLSAFPRENEFLLNNYSMFTVDKLEKVDGIWRVELTWVGRLPSI